MNPLDTKVDQIKDKLRKLISKEASLRELGNLAEAETFASSIQALMIQYQIELDDVMKYEQQRVYSIRREDFDTSDLVIRHESNWVAVLYCSCSPSAFCQTLLNPNAGANYVVIFGDNSDREMLHYMVTAMVQKIRLLARLSFSNYQGYDKRNTFIRSFLKGCSLGIRSRLEMDMKKREENSQQVYGIVLDKNRAVEQFMEDQGIKVQKAKARKLGSGDGFRQGMVAGQNMDHELNKANKQKWLK